MAGPQGVTVLTASGASPFVAGMLEHAFAAPANPAAPVVEVAPGDPQDPRGTAFGSLVLPLVLASIVTGVVISLLGRAGPRQIVALLGAAAAAGLVAIGMVQGWLGILEGDRWVNAGVLSLTMVAVASVLARLNGLIGHAGLGLGALLMILVANPWSGISSAPGVLPTGVDATGQLLPPGAGGNLLRSTAFFDGAGAARHLAVLVVWTAFGLTDDVRRGGAPPPPLREGRRGALARRPRASARLTRAPGARRTRAPRHRSGRSRG